MQSDLGLFYGSQNFISQHGSRADAPYEDRRSRPCKKHKTALRDASFCRAQSYIVIAQMVAAFAGACPSSRSGRPSSPRASSRDKAPMRNGLRRVGTSVGTARTASPLAIMIFRFGCRARGREKSSRVVIAGMALSVLISRGASARASRNRAWSAVDRDGVVTSPACHCQVRRRRRSARGSRPRSVAAH